MQKIFIVVKDVNLNLKFFLFVFLSLHYFKSYFFSKSLIFLRVAIFLYKSCLEKPKKLKNAGQNNCSFRELFFDIAEFSK